MAATPTGTPVLIQSSAQSGSQSITIPTDAQLVAVGVSIYEPSANWLPANPLTINSVNLVTVQKTDEQTANGQVWLGYVKTADTGTGSRTFAWNWGTLPDEGAQISISFWKSLNVSGDPINSSGQNLNANTDLTGLTSGTNDVMVGIVYSYTAITSVTDNSQTQIHLQGVFNGGAALGSAYKVSATGFYYTGGSYHTCAAMVIKGVAGGQSVILGQLSSTETVQPISKRKRKTLGQPSETGSILPVTRRKVKTLGLLSETGAAQSMSKIHTKTVGVLTSTETLQPIQRYTKEFISAFGNQFETVAEAPWADEPWSLGVSERSVTASTFDTPDQTQVLKVFDFDFIKTIPANAIITGISVSVTAKYANGTGSINLVQLLDVNKNKVGDNKASTPSALTTNYLAYSFGAGFIGDMWGLSLTADWIRNNNFGLAVGCLATGTDTDVFVSNVSINVYYDEPYPDTYLNGLREIESPLPIARIKRKTLGILTETGSILPLGQKINVTLGLLVESGTIQPVGKVKSTTIGLLNEIGTVNSLNRSKTRALGLLSSVESLQPFTARRSKLLGILLETGSINPIAKKKSKTLSELEETSLLLGFSGVVNITIGILTENGTVFPIGKLKRKTLGMLEESDSLLDLSTSKAKTLGQILETGLLFPIVNGAAAPIPPYYVYIVEPEDRVYLIPPDDEIVTVVYSVPPENNVYIIPADE